MRTSAASGNPGLILTPGPAGAWDDARVSGPRVLRAADGTWRMWYYGRNQGFAPDIPLPTGRCGLAESADGLHWRRVHGPLTDGAVFEPHPDPARFDSAHVGVSDVVPTANGYRMWYFGGDHSQFRFGRFEVRGLQLRPGSADSTDGLHWQRRDGPHRGAWLDLGPTGAFDSATVGWPQVVIDPDGVQRLYYHSLDPTRMQFVVGLAESTDGQTWQRRGEVLGPGDPGRFDAGGVGTRHVLAIDGAWWMFYEGVAADGHRAIGLARSTDGRHWTRQPGHEANGAIFSHAPRGSGRWDAFAVGTPCVVPLPDGGYHLYYVGANETPAGFADELGMIQQIGCAHSAGADFTRWERFADHHHADDPLG